MANFCFCNSMLPSTLTGHPLGSFNSFYMSQLGFSNGGTTNRIGKLATFLVGYFGGDSYLNGPGISKCGTLLDPETLTQAGKFLEPIRFSSSPNSYLPASNPDKSLHLPKIDMALKTQTYRPTVGIFVIIPGSAN